MNPRTREALELLQQHGSATITTEATQVIGKGKTAELFLNYTSALALERRGLVVFEYDGEATYAELVAAAA